MTKFEMLAFVDYLKNKAEVIVDRQLVSVQKSMFGRFEKVDMGERAKEMLEVIKESPSAESACRKIAHEIGKKNPIWKDFRGGSFMFREDFEEYMLENPEEKKNPTLFRWQEQAGFETREVFRKYFPTEYANFMYNLENNGTDPFSVTTHSDKGVYNAFRIEKQKACKISGEFGSQVPKKLTIGFNSSQSETGMNDIIPLAKFMCGQLGLDEIILADYDSAEVFMVKKM